MRRTQVAVMVLNAAGTLFALLLACAALAETVDEKVPRELFEQANAEPAILVLVGLKVPWQREDTLGENEIVAQREAIRSAQQRLLLELAGTKHNVIRRYEVIPGIALEVGLDALNVLAGSPTVTNVLPDRPARPPR